MMRRRQPHRQLSASAPREYLRQLCQVVAGNDEGRSGLSALGGLEVGLREVELAVARCCSDDRRGGEIGFAFHRVWIGGGRDSHRRGAICPVAPILHLDEVISLHEDPIHRPGERDIGSNYGWSRSAALTVSNSWLEIERMRFSNTVARRGSNG